MYSTTITTHSATITAKLHIIYWGEQSYGFLFSETFNPYVRILQNIIALLHLSITYLILCTMSYAERWTHVQGSSIFICWVLMYTWGTSTYVWFIFCICGLVCAFPFRLDKTSNSDLSQTLWSYPAIFVVTIHCIDCI